MAEGVRFAFHGAFLHFSCLAFSAHQKVAFVGPPPAREQHIIGKRVAAYGNCVLQLLASRALLRLENQDAGAAGKKIESFATFQDSGSH